MIRKVVIQRFPSIRHPKFRRDDGSRLGFFAGPTVRHRKTKRQTAARITGAVFRMTVIVLYVIFICNSSAFAASVYQDTNRFTYGFKRVLAAPFQLPAYLFKGTFYGPPLIGTLGGVVQGTFQTVGELVGGIFDMGAALAPYAKYAAFA